MFRRHGVLILSLCVAALVVYGLFTLTKRMPMTRTVERQTLPPLSPLELPPQAPIPSSPIIFPNAAQHSPQEEASPSPSEAVRRPAIVVRKPVRIPSQWEIVNQYRQVIRLDAKYLQVAVTSDRYGYHNQAILYYRKYLNVAPSSPYADRIRNRLAQLEGGG